MDLQIKGVTFGGKAVNRTVVLMSSEGAKKLTPKTYTYVGGELPCKGKPKENVMGTLRVVLADESGGRGQIDLQAAFVEEDSQGNFVFALMDEAKHVTTL